VLVDAFGCRWTLDVRGLEPGLADELERLWDRARVGAPDGLDGARPFVVRRREDGGVDIDGARHDVPDEHLPYALSRAVTVASIGRRTGECLMLHAAGLALPDGSTVALVAASGTGKTTAGAVLGRHLGYVSDETVAVEHDLRVRAYPKPLSVVTDPSRPMSKHERSPDELGLRRAPGDLHLVATVVIERDPDLRAPVLEPLGLVEAASLVLPQTSALPRLDRPLARLAAVLTAGHGPWRLRYAEVADCVDLVEQLASGGTPGGDPGAVTWEWVDGRDRAVPEEPATHDPGPAALVQRAPFDDALVSDGDVLVLHDRVPTTLPGLAATTWLLLEEPMTVGAVVDALTGALGPHPDAEAIVTDTLRVLREGGLVVGTPAPRLPAPDTAPGGPAVADPPGDLPVRGRG
jgi:hypothetical protein